MAGAPPAGGRPVVCRQWVGVGGMTGVAGQAELGWGAGMHPQELCPSHGAFARGHSCRMTCRRLMQLQPYAD